MAWLDDDLLRRVPISVVTPASGTTASMTFDVEIPEGLDEFWENVDNSGDEIRVTFANGVTPATYDWRGAFNKSGRSATLVLENVATGGDDDRLLLFWLYYRLKAGASLTDGSGTATTSDGAGYIETSAPSYNVVGVRPPGERETTPRAAFAKSETDNLFVWLDVQSLLEPAARPWRGKRFLEEPGRTTVRVLDSSGTVTSSPDAVVDPQGLRWATYRRPGSRLDRACLRVPVAEGQSGSTYAIECRFETTHPQDPSSVHRDLAPRVGFRVQDLLET